MGERPSHARLHERRRLVPFPFSDLSATNGDPPSCRAHPTRTFLSLIRPRTSVPRSRRSRSSQRIRVFAGSLRRRSKNEVGDSVGCCSRDGSVDWALLTGELDHDGVSINTVPYEKAVAMNAPGLQHCMLPVVRRRSWQTLLSHEHERTTALDLHGPHRDHAPVRKLAHPDTPHGALTGNSGVMLRRRERSRTTSSAESGGDLRVSGSCHHQLPAGPSLAAYALSSSSAT
jgi:hypothetical protein